MTELRVHILLKVPYKNRVDFHKLFRQEKCINRANFLVFNKTHFRIRFCAIIFCKIQFAVTTIPASRFNFKMQQSYFLKVDKKDPKFGETNFAIVCFFQKDRGLNRTFEFQPIFYIFFSSGNKNDGVSQKIVQRL